MQLFSAEIAVPQYLCKQPLADALIPMHRHHRAAVITVPKKMMAAFNPNDLKANSLQCLDQSAACQGRERGHTLTATR